MEGGQNRKKWKQDTTNKPKGPEGEKRKIEDYPEEWCAIVTLDAKNEDSSTETLQQKDISAKRVVTGALMMGTRACQMNAS